MSPPLRSLGIALCLVGSIACAEAVKPTSQTVLVPAPTAPELVPSDASPAEPDASAEPPASSSFWDTAPPTLVFYLQRGACRGYCPSYTVMVHDDGRVEYQGKSCVGTTGAQESQVSPAKVRKVAARFRSAGSLDFQEEYLLGGHPDSVEVTTALSFQGERRAVRHYHSAKAPAALTRLEASIDKLANTRQWVACRKSKDGACYDCRAPKRKSPMVTTRVKKLVKEQKLKELVTAHDEVAVIGVFEVKEASVQRRGTRGQRLVATLDSVAPLSSMIHPSTAVNQFWGSIEVAAGELYVVMLAPGGAGPWTILGLEKVSSVDEGRALASELLDWLGLL